MGNKIECPLMKQLIDDGICFDIHMVVEGLAPVDTVPEAVFQTEDYKDVCIKCKHHRD